VLRQAVAARWRRLSARDGFHGRAKLDQGRRVRKGFAVVFAGWAQRLRAGGDGTPDSRPPVTSN
jgi:hypothetical protein